MAGESFQERRVEAWDKVTPDYIEWYMSQERESVVSTFAQIFPDWDPEAEPTNADQLGIKILFNSHLSCVERALKSGAADGAAGIAFLDHEAAVQLEES